MNNENTTFKQLLLGIVMIIIPALVIGLIIADSKLAYGLGLFLGTATAIFLLKHMAITLSKALDMPPKQAEKYAIRNYFIRYVVNIGILVISVLYSGISIIGVLIGLMSMKLSAFLYPYIDRLINRRKS
jgi:undecaprenyl pyrophosphate phosphatase UppP